MATAKFDRDKLPKGTTDWDALDELSDEEVERRAESDSDGKPLTEEDLSKLKRSPRVRVIRMALGVASRRGGDGAAKLEEAQATLGEFAQTEPAALE